MKTIVPFAVSLVLLASALARAADPLKCDFSGIPGPRITVKLESRDLTGAVLSIPAPYLMSRARDGEVRETLLLSVWRETMLPYTREDLNSDDQRRKYKIGKGEDLTILISPLTDLETIAQRHIATAQGLKLNGPAMQLRGRLLENTLIAQESKPKPRQDDIFFSMAGDKVRDVISCDQLGDVPTPGCSHVFEVGAYDVKTSYRRELLDNWKSYKAKVSKLLDCLSVIHPQDLLEQ
jgi:hypothetical protein